MTEKLSQRFFGNKIFKKEHYDMVGDLPLYDPVVMKVFSKQVDKYAKMDESLIQLFVDYVSTNMEFAYSQEFSFQKFTTFVELTVYLFEWSFDNHKTRKESFAEFGQLVIRHSLFRPPHSVNVFNQKDVKEIAKFWLETFDRYYEMYDRAFGSNLDNVIHTFGATQTTESSLKAGKAVADRNAVLNLLGIS